MIGDVQKPVSFESAELFRWMGKDLHPALDEPYDAINRAAARWTTSTPTARRAS